MIRTAVCFAFLCLTQLQPGDLSAVASAADSPPLAAPSSGQAAGAATLIAHPTFDWSRWQRIPVFSDGRLKPLDSLADEMVNLVTGRSKWTDPDAEAAGTTKPVTFSAPELVYGWITRPDDRNDRPL